MADLRYPVGPFSAKGSPLTAQEREQMLGRLEDHPARMRAAVEGLTDEQLDTPYREGGWTVRQVVHHVVDSHLNSYVRFKIGMTEDNGAIRPYEQGEWAELGEAKSAPIDLSLPLLDALHARWVTFLRTLSDEDFQRSVHHPEMGRDLTLDTLLEIYGWHCLHHETHITALRDRMGW